jgi:hypothetical protein
MHEAKGVPRLKWVQRQVTGAVTNCHSIENHTALEFGARERLHSERYDAYRSALSSISCSRYLCFC